MEASAYGFRCGGECSTGFGERRLVRVGNASGEEDFGDEAVWIPGDLRLGWSSRIIRAWAAEGVWNTPNPVVSFQKTAKGLEVTQKDGVLRLEVKAEDVLHVIYSPLGTARHRASVGSCDRQAELACGGLRGRFRTREDGDAFRSRKA